MNKKIFLILVCAIALILFGSPRVEAQFLIPQTQPAPSVNSEIQPPPAGPAEAMLPAVQPTSPPPGGGEVGITSPTPPAQPTLPTQNPAPEQPVPVQSVPAQPVQPAAVQPAPVQPIPPPLPVQPSPLFSAPEQLDFANGLFTKGIYKMAESEYRQFLSQFPQDERVKDAVFGVAESLFYQKSYPESYEAYRDFKEKYPQDKNVPVATLRQGQARYHQAKYDESLLNLSPLLAQELPAPFKQSLYFYLGQANLGKSNQDKALEYLRDAAAETSDKTYTSLSYLDIGELLNERSQFAEAIDSFQKAFENAANDEMKALSIYRQGEAQFLANQFEQSAEAFRRVFKEFPQEKISQDALTNLILALSNLGKNEEIVAVFNEQRSLVKDEPRFFEGYLSAAQALAATDRAPDALGILDMMLGWPSLDEAKRNNILVNKAQVLILAKRSPEAIGLLDQQLASLSADREKSIYTKAEALFASGQFDLAGQEYSALLKDFPASTYAADAKYGLAHSRYSAGALAEAMELFLDYFHTAGDPVKKQEALSNALSIAQKSQQVEKSVELGELYLMTYPDDPHCVEILMTLGTMFTKQDRHEPSVTFLYQYVAAAKDPKNLQQANFLLGFSLQALKRYDEALAVYDLAAKAEGSKDIAQSALKNSAVIYLEKDDQPRAAEIFNRMINEFEKPPLDAKTYLWLAQYYWEQKRFDELLKFTQDVAGKEINAAIAGELAYFTAEAFREKNDCGQAFPKFDESVKALAADSAFIGPARLGKAQCLMAEQSWDEARSELTQLVNSYPKDERLLLRARFELANLERSRNNLEESVKIYMLIAVLYADDEYTPQSLWNAAEIFEILLRNDDSRKAYQELINRYPQSALAQKAREKILVPNGK